MSKMSKRSKVWKVSNNLILTIYFLCFLIWFMIRFLIPIERIFQEIKREMAEDEREAKKNKQ